MPPISRRVFVSSVPLVVAACGAAGRSVRKNDATLAALELRCGGRLGVAAVDLGTARSIENRADERFPLCSTFKTLLVAACLQSVDQGEERLDRKLPVRPKDLLEYAPVTRLCPPGGAMTIEALCEAAITVSDNTAANLLLRELGGPAGFTGRLRSLGDRVTRLDRTEPTLNDAVPGDPRDTTTPRAMAENLRNILLGTVLSEGSRSRIVEWHRQTRTGPGRLRAGLPPPWTLAHKTGTGEHGAINDVGVVWPPGRAPVLVAAYYAEGPGAVEDREGVLAAVARIVSTSLT